MKTTTGTLTVGQIRKAIKNLPDEAEVQLEIAVSDSTSEECAQAMADIVLERAFRDVLHGVLVIDGQLDS